MVQLGALVCLHSGGERMHVYAGGETLPRTACVVPFLLVEWERRAPSDSFVSLFPTRAQINAGLSWKQESVEGCRKTESPVDQTTTQQTPTQTRFVTGQTISMLMLMGILGT